LKTLQESFGITTVYVTHDQEEALALSDRIALMHEGALVEVGSPKDLYLRREMLLATPIGRFAAQRSGEWDPGMPAQLFFRPESVEIVEGALDGRANTAFGSVERVTFLGSFADVVLRCNDLKIRARTHPTRAPAVGANVSFVVPRDACIVFPR
jgi:ABC-type sugar transport system ATPase subunit